MKKHEQINATLENKIAFIMWEQYGFRASYRLASSLSDYFHYELTFNLNIILRNFLGEENENISS